MQALTKQKVTKILVFTPFTHISHEKAVFILRGGIKTLEWPLDASLKNTFFKFFCFFVFSFLHLSCEKLEKAYFDQHLEFPAPKDLSKYTINAKDLTKKGGGDSKDLATYFPSSWSDYKTLTSYLTFKLDQYPNLGPKPLPFPVMIS